ncbi:MAG: 4a-hydroxytetrahydrobiopterin dehydratase [Acidobacteriota bacterium]|nr:4a-hydroxytetrahydrobiopterin dehydratase [Acidobacteriota bacterium]
MERKKLSDAEIENFLADLNDWEAEDNNLKKHFEFENFAESLAFVNRVGAIADERDHHPDVLFGWGYAEFFITTHDAGGITAKDFELAKAIEAIETKGE